LVNHHFPVVVFPMIQAIHKMTAATSSLATSNSHPKCSEKSHGLSPCHILLGGAITILKNMS
jgi:hypothetical protein